MGTVATSTSTSASRPPTGFGNQQHIVRFANGVLMGMVYNGTNLEFRDNTDNNVSAWAALGAGGTVSGWTYVEGAFALDASGFVHLLGNDGPSGNIRYQRGTTDAARTSITTWDTAFLVNTGIQTPALTVHAEATGWKVHTVHDFSKPNYVRLNVASGGAVTSDNGGGTALTTVVTTGQCYPGIEQDAAKNLFAWWSMGATGVGKGVRASSAPYPSWTWGTSEIIDEANFAAGGIISGDVDGSGRAVVAFKKSTDNLLTVFRRNAGTWSVLPSIPSVTPTSVQVVCDGDDDYVLFTYSGGTGYLKYTATTGAWGSVVNLDADTTAKNAACRRDTSGSAIDWMVTTGSASPFTIKAGRISLQARSNRRGYNAPIFGRGRRGLVT